MSRYWRADIGSKRSDSRYLYSTGRFSLGDNHKLKTILSATFENLSTGAEAILSATFENLSTGVHIVDNIQKPTYWSGGHIVGDI